MPEMKQVNKSPLHGIPPAIKDNDTADKMQTTAGSIAGGHIASKDTFL
jgi:Asp-tRNA(Asn)/Glu-tRNA(Gln) amidotransferase A subunit family amidase